MPRLRAIVAGAQRPVRWESWRKYVFVDALAASISVRLPLRVEFFGR
jgi:hypothetical protein